MPNWTDENGNCHFDVDGTPCYRSEVGCPVHREEKPAPKRKKKGNTTLINNQMLQQLQEAHVTLQVIDGTTCRENQEKGQGPCGICRECERDRVVKLLEILESYREIAGVDFDDMWDDETTLNPPWLNSYVCRECRAKIYKGSHHKMSCRSRTP